MRPHRQGCGGVSSCRKLAGGFLLLAAALHGIIAYGWLLMMGRDVHESNDTGEPHANGPLTIKSGMTIMTTMPNATLLAMPTYHVRRRILSLGEFGLGHRLAKLSAVYDLAHELPVDAVDLHWGECNDGTSSSSSNISVDILLHLFGWKRLRIPVTENANDNRANYHDQRDEKLPLLRTIRIRNNVLGYEPGQSFKNARIPITAAAQHRWRRKLQRDVRLYRHLQHTFQGRHEVAQFCCVHHMQACPALSWSSTRSSVMNHSAPNYPYYTVGWHLRGGNGEEHHFVQAGRQVSNWDDWIGNLTQLTRRLVQQQAGPGQVFVATDTVALVSLAARHLRPYHIRVVTWPQHRLARGVAFFAQHGPDCMDGWMASAYDMMVLAQVDTVVAATQSSFTQTLPLTLQLADTILTTDLDSDSNSTLPYRFCEAQNNRMSCFATYDAWLYRRKDDAMMHIDLTDVSAAAVRNVSLPQPVIHKNIVHFPDDVLVDSASKTRLRARLYLQQAGVDEDGDLRYGFRFNPAYRKAENYTLEWTWA